MNRIISNVPKPVIYTCVKKMVPDRFVGPQIPT